jgi:hypothetical protein
MTNTNIPHVAANTNPSYGDTVIVSLYFGILMVFFGHIRLGICQRTLQKFR